jgi:hypothetical protein
MNSKTKMLRGRFGLALPVALFGLALAGSAGAAGPFDGVYKGTQTGTLNDNSGNCRNMDLPSTSIRITDNHFTRKWYTDIDVDVGGDGAFHASALVPGARPARTENISGKITGNKLEADIGSSHCGAHLSLTKS